MGLLTLPLGFDAVELTNTLNLEKPVKVFPFPDPFETNTVYMSTNVYAISREYEQGRCLVKTSEYCAPPQTVNRGRTQDMIFGKVPHTSIVGGIDACDHSGRVKFNLADAAAGGPSLVNYAEEIVKEQVSMRSKLEETLFYRKVRAMFGQILDADGSLLLDLYDQFAVQPIELVWNISNVNFDLRGAVKKLKKSMRDAYFGNMASIGVLVTLDDLIKIQNLKQSVEEHNRCCDKLAAQNLSLDNAWYFDNVIFYTMDATGCFYDAQGVKKSIDYLAPPIDPSTITAANPAGAPYANPVGLAFPVATSQINYELLVAPAATFEDMNKAASSIYYSWIDDSNCSKSHISLHAEFNALPIVKQPQSLQRIKFS